MKLLSLWTKGKILQNEFANKNTKSGGYLILLTLMITIIFPLVLDNGLSDNFEYMVSHKFMTIGFIIFMSILIYSIVDKYLGSHDHLDVSNDYKKLAEDLSSDYKIKSDDLDKKLHLIQSMLKTKGLDTIVTNDDVEKVEGNADEIIIIVDNLSLDLPREYTDSFKNKPKDFKTVYEAVHRNIKEGKQYTYYLKYDNDTHHDIALHMKVHYSRIIKDLSAANDKKIILEPIFILIPSNEFQFFSDIYIYKSNSKKTEAYEWLPTLTKDKTLFYLNFDIHQTKKLEHILVTTKKKYGITYGTNLHKNEEYIVNASYIKTIEQKSKKIQIITDDLSDDLKNGIFFDTVNSNLIQGIHYTYFLPNSKKTQHMIEQYKDDHKLSGHNKVVFQLIPDNMFFFFNNVYIYDEKRAFEFIPTSNMYFIYDNKQLEKLLFSIKTIEITLKKDS